MAAMATAAARQPKAIGRYSYGHVAIEAAVKNTIPLTTSAVAADITTKTETAIANKATQPPVMQQEQKPQHAVTT